MRPLPCSVFNAGGMFQRKKKSFNETWVVVGVMGVPAKVNVLRKILEI